MTDNQDWRGEHFLRMTTDAYAARGRNFKTQTPKTHNMITDQVIARREKVARLAALGNSKVRIAEILGLEYHLVWGDFKSMKILPPRKSA